MTTKRWVNKRVRLLVVWGSASVLLVGGAAAGLVALGRRPRQSVQPAGDMAVGVTSVLGRRFADAPAPIRFEDVTSVAGIRFTHFPATRASLLPEDMGSGVALGDYDLDGDDDLFAVNTVGSVEDGAPHDNDAGRSRLYRNDGGGRFVDVTESSGITFAGFGMGAAWGDYDNDADPDLYITAYGNNVLYKNTGDGRFVDVTSQAGVGDGRFGTGCGWSDYDRDGDIDLYVTHYVDFVRLEGDRTMKDPEDPSQPYTINPSSYDPVPNALFRNNGDGTFSDVANEAGVMDPEGRGLSAAWADFDNDQWPDLYVANDISKNAVFRNFGDGTFQDIGTDSLAADYRSAMGSAVADLDEDGDLDLFITHWIAQENALYRNMLVDRQIESAKRDLWFMDMADQWGVGQIALDVVGWATGFCDFDNDGRLDLWVVNGHTFERIDDHRRLIPQPAFVFWNRGPDGFVELAARTCLALNEPFVGRGGAQADFDGDGRVDLVLLAHGAGLMLLRNTSTAPNHWLRIELRQNGGNTAALGARVHVKSGGRRQCAEVGCSPSYLSQSEHTLHFGLGAARRAESVEIHWPDGAVQVLRDVEADQVLCLTHLGVYPVPPTITGAALSWLSP